LAEEFANELLKDPKSLKESIKAKIKEMVYSKPATKKPAAKRPATKKPAVAKAKPAAPATLAGKKPTAKRQSPKRNITELPLSEQES
jgi:hypothetical protein